MIDKQHIAFKFVLQHCMKPWQSWNWPFLQCKDGLSLLCIYGDARTWQPMSCCIETCTAANQIRLTGVGCHPTGMCEHKAQFTNTLLFTMQTVSLGTCIWDPIYQGCTDLQSPVKCLDQRYCDRYSMQSCKQFTERCRRVHFRELIIGFIPLRKQFNGPTLEAAMVSS